MRIPSLLLIFTSCLLLPACATTYSADAIEGHVIDKDTGRPLEGVSVVASWGLFYGTLGGRNAVGNLVILEAQTDKEGRFKIPAWGPKRVKDVAMKQETPDLLFFKSGYRLIGMSNNPSWPTTTYRTRSDWDGKTISLSKFEGTNIDYARQLNNGYVEESTKLYQSECGWKLIPNTLHALKAQDDVFQKNGIEIRYIADLKLHDTYLQSKGCGSVNELLGGKHE